MSAVETISFNICGASTALPFNVAVQAGFLIANDATFASATKVGEVISITNSEITVYDRANEAPGAQYTDSGQTALFQKHILPLRMVILFFYLMKMKLQSQVRYQSRLMMLHLQL